jgi:thioredoxin reductase (NADPH)
MDKTFKQVATSVGQGCAAAIQAERWLADMEAHGYEGAADPRVFRMSQQMAAA